MSEAATDSQLAEDNTLYYFPVSITKLILMSLATFGFYELYWFYKNWVIIKEREKSDIRPFWRTVFLIFFVYPLFKQINGSASFFQLNKGINPGWLAAAYIGLSLAVRLPDSYYLVSYLAVLVLLPVQTVVNQVNLKARPAHSPNDKFSLANYLIVAIGGILFLLILVGSFLPGDNNIEVPAAVGENFLQALKGSDYDTAYALLHPDLQDEISGTDALEMLFPSGIIDTWESDANFFTTTDGESAVAVFGIMTLSDGSQFDMEVIVYRVGEENLVAGFLFQPR